MPADLLPAECFGLPQPLQRLLWQPSLHAEDDDLMKLYAGGIELGQEFGLGEPLRTLQPLGRSDSPSPIGEGFELAGNAFAHCGTLIESPDRPTV
jgi:hypothetical protein